MLYSISATESVDTSFSYDPLIFADSRMPLFSGFNRI